MNEENQKTNLKGEKVFSTSETVLLVILSLLIGLSIGYLYNNTMPNNKKELENDKYIQEFAKNYNYILENYYKEVDKEALINSAIAGMMESLDDPYSVYINDDEINNFSITLNGSYQGIGVQIIKDPDTGYILVTSVFKDSPASEVGIIPGDKIISIDEKSSSELSVQEFSKLIKNSKKPTYIFKILRDEKEIELTVAKSNITLTSVASETYDIDDKKVGYVYIGIFANNTLSQFQKQLKELESENIDYLIIDVRGNTGGHLTSVHGMLDLFLDKNQIMYQFEQSGKKTAIYGTENEKKDYEIILLGDETSASASEVLIAGLKENLGSTFIGKKTYGKGTVQELVTLSDGTQYKITIKKWLTPKGNWINDTEGIEPDINVELDEKYFKSYDVKDDTQIQEAFKYIKNKQNT